ncbi:MAG: response regulator transcription factor [Clostridia bacterium]|nr:response regulator transcription factor [Clostridia bacterium]
MNNIRILIADDDPGMRLVMQKLAEKAEGYALVGAAVDGNDLLEKYEETKPDVVLMDVEMPGMTGIECAKVIQDRNPRTILIFATAHEQYMRSAFEVYAFDYLVKPFKVERALNTLSRIRDILTAQSVKAEPVRPAQTAASGRLMLKHREGLSFVDIPGILLIQREERSSVLYLADGSRYVSSDSLSDFEERLPGDLFFRSHKSYIINLNHIDSISPYGRWTYIVKLRGTDRDALITHERFEELEKLFA